MTQQSDVELAHTHSSRHRAEVLASTVWSSIVHGGIMAIQSIANPRHIGHLWGDVAALIVVAAVLAALTPRQGAGRTSSAAA
jgi:hypothetical protein